MRFFVNRFSFRINFQGLGSMFSDPMKQIFLSTAIALTWREIKSALLDLDRPSRSLKLYA